MYLQSILYTITEIREDIETALNIKCHILVRSVDEETIEIEIEVPEYAVTYTRTYTATEIAGMQYPTAGMTQLKNDAKQILGEMIIK